MLLDVVIYIQYCIMCGYLYSLYLCEGSYSIFYVLSIFVSAILGYVFICHMSGQRGTASSLSSFVRIISRRLDEGFISDISFPEVIFA